MLEPVLLLASVDVEPLAEVAAPVEQADPDHLERLVARLLEDVAREDAEAARVDRHRLVEAELGAHEDDRPVDSGPAAVGPAQSCSSSRAASVWMRSISSGFRSAASCVAGQRSLRNATGFSPESSPSGAG